MKPVLFSIGSFNVYGYGLMLALAVVAAFGVACFRAKKFYNTDPDLIFNCGLIGIAFGLLGAKVTYWLVEIQAVIENPKILLDLGGGFVVYGGVILGILMPILFLRFIKKTSALDKIDLAMPSIALGQAIGRIGCLLAGCCYGAEAPEGAWYAITFPAGAEAPAGIPLYPTQILSSIGDLALFLFLMLYTNRSKFRGQILCLYMILYAIGRYLVEMLRDDPRGTVGPFSTSQFISIFILLGGIALWIFFWKKNYAPLRRTGEYKKPPVEKPVLASEANAEPENAEPAENTVSETEEAAPDTENTEQKEKTEVQES